MKKILFYRDYQEFTGGHLVHSQYFKYTQNHPNYYPAIVFSKNSLTEKNSYWPGIDSDRDTLPIMYFIAGQDWEFFRSLENFSVTPKINLIQHIRHANSNDCRFQYLTEKAVRICVSEEVHQVVKATGKANGPLITINNETDIPIADSSLIDKALDSSKVLLVAYKNRSEGRRFAAMCRHGGIHYTLIDELLPRKEFIRLLNEYLFVVFFPFRTEGFYLPALEAMACGCIVLVPDVIGNRSFCLDNENCHVTRYEVNAMYKGLQRMINSGNEQRTDWLNKARDTALQYKNNNMQHKYWDLLDNIKDLW